MAIDALAALLFGAVQGVTEFWPISSSGHLIILHELLPVAAIDRLAFDVALHLGTFLATAWYFRRELRDLLRSLVVRGTFPRETRAPRRLALQIAAGTLPTVAIALLLEPWVEGPLRSALLVAALLVFGGAVFLIVERVSHPRQTVPALSVRDALLIGAAQGIAVIPGVSRSGSTIIAGLLVGLQRTEAVRFSFLLSLPTVFGAALRTLSAYLAEGPQANDLVPFLLGMAASTIVGIFALAFLVRFLSRATLKPFGVYRIVAGVLFLAFLLLR